MNAQIDGGEYHAAPLDVQMGDIINRYPQRQPVHYQMSSGNDVGRPLLFSGGDYAYGPQQADYNVMPHTDWRGADLYNQQAIDQAESLASDDYDYKPRRWLTLINCAVVGLVTIITFAVGGGRLSVLSHPLNYHGLACGWDEPVQHLPFVYYPIDPKDGKEASLMAHRPTCVKHCPDEIDVAKKAHLSVSEASAVSVGQSSALLSILHSMRSPVYASTSDYSSYCIPNAPDLRNQLEKIIVSTQSYQKSFLRSIAATIVSGLPSILIAAVLAAATAHLANITPYCLAKLSQHGTLLAGLIVAFVGLFAGTRYSEWQSALLCTVLSLNLIVHALRGGDAPTLGYKLLGEFEPLICSFPDTRPYLMTAQMLGSVTIYATLTAFSFLQTTKSSTEGIPLEYSLDPNGGLKIIPLEMSSTESRRSLLWTFAHSAGLLICAIVLLELFTRMYTALVVLVTIKIYKHPAFATDDEDDVKPMQFALTRLPSALRGIMQDTTNLVFARFLCPIAYIRNQQETPFFSERLERLSNNAALIQYCLDLTMCEFDKLDTIDYEKSDELATDSLGCRAGIRKPLEQTAAVSANVLLSAVACIFAVTYSIFLFVNGLGSVGVTPKSPLLTSMLVTGLFSHIAKTGLNTPALAVETLLYCYAVQTDGNEFISDDVYLAVKTALGSASGKLANN